MLERFHLDRQVIDAESIVKLFPHRRKKFHVPRFARMADMGG